MRNVFFASALLAVAACHQSTIQGDYKDISSGCRSSAEDKVAITDSDAKSQATRNAELVTLFSDCMAKQGWAVATPKRAKAPGKNEEATTKTTGPSDAGGKATTLTTPEPNKGNPAAQATEPLPGTPPLATGTAAPTYYQSTQPVTQPVGQPGYSIYQPAYPAPAAGTVPPAITPSPGVPQRY